VEVSYPFREDAPRIDDTGFGEINSGLGRGRALKKTIVECVLDEPLIGTVGGCNKYIPMNAEYKKAPAVSDVFWPE
jgi:hypothetical protein